MRLFHPPTTRESGGEGMVEEEVEEEEDVVGEATNMSDSLHAVAWQD